MMPRMNGNQLLEAVRAISPEMGFVFTTGYSKSSISESGDLPERVHFHTKPANFIKVLESLEELSQRISKQQSA